jgi:hypothetical protein
MLGFDKVKNHAGMTLVGNYDTLCALHEVIHKVAEESALLREPADGEFLLGLAYDVRKAFELQREVIEPPAHHEEIGRRYGVKVLWPTFLVQVRLLREAMAFCPTDERDQGIVFLLEHAAHSGLVADMGGTTAVDSWRRLSCNPADMTDRVESRTGLFLQWRKAERRAGLGQLLDSLDSMFEFWHERAPEAWRWDISPEAFEAIEGLAEFADPKW